MPGVAVHLHLARRVLDRWDRRPRTAPFDILDPTLVNAFRVGAMGPDAGYVPGGFRPLSDLAHSLRSGTLTRALLDGARTSLERAFAWGWVTHVLADTRIHPLVGLAVGELRTGSRAVFIDGGQDTLAHIRAETGLDAHYVGDPRETSLQSVFDLHSISFLRGAYRRTYGVAPDRRRLLASHCRLPRRMSQGLWLTRLSKTMLPTVPGAQDEPSPIRHVRARVGRTSVPAAFLLPAAPRPWFLEAVRAVEEKFEQDVAEVRATGGDCLPNVNLDTGGPDLCEVGYPGLRNACMYIQEQGGSPPRLHEPVPGAA